MISRSWNSDNPGHHKSSTCSLRKHHPNPKPHHLPSSRECVSRPKTWLRAATQVSIRAQRYGKEQKQSRATKAGAQSFFSKLSSGNTKWRRQKVCQTLTEQTTFGERSNSPGTWPKPLEKSQKRAKRREREGDLNASFHLLTPPPLPSPLLQKSHGSFLSPLPPPPPCPKRGPYPATTSTSPARRFGNTIPQQTLSVLHRRHRSSTKSLFSTTPLPLTALGCGRPERK